MKFSSLKFSIVLISIVGLASLIFNPDSITHHMIVWDVAFLCSIVGGLN